MLTKLANKLVENKDALGTIMSLECGRQIFPTLLGVKISSRTYEVSQD